MEDFDQKLEALIYKYHIYQYNNKLLTQLETQKKIQNLWNKLEGEKIVIWGGGWHTYKIFQCLNDEQKKKIFLIIDKNPEGKERFEYGIGIITPEEFSLLCLKATIIISSYKYRREIAIEIYNNEWDCNIVDLYDYLEEKHINYTEEFYKSPVITYEDMFILRKRIKKETNLNEKKRLFRKLIGEYVAIRDFKNAFLYIKLGITREEQDYNDYKEFVEKVSELFEELKKALNSKEHIVMNWLDALRYDEIKYMPFVDKIARQGMLFENAYAVSTYTNAAFKTMLTGKLFIDDKLYKEKIEDLSDTKLIKNLKENDYSFYYAGQHCTSQAEYTINKVSFLYRCYDSELRLPDSLLLWSVLDFLSTKESKCCIFIHCLSETHPPYFSSKLRKMKKYNGWICGEAMDNQKEKDATLKQIIRSMRDFDKQLEWYHFFCGEKFINIFMSDHGQYRGEKPICIDGINHIVFQINGQNIPTNRLDKIFGLNCFPQLIEHLVKKEWDKIDDVLTDTGVIQTDDIYNPSHVEYCLNAENDQIYYDLYSQHRGIVTPKEIYVKYVSGQEYFFIKGDKDNLINDLFYEKRIQELKSMCGNNFIKISEEKKYFPAQEMYKKHNLKYL